MPCKLLILAADQLQSQDKKGAGSVNVRAMGAAKNTILIAEDDAEVRRFVTTILQDRGFHVIAASDAKQALTRARSFEGEIEILLTDVEMGKLDGFDLRERLLQERPKVKVVVMSGRLGEDFEAIDFPILRKPFSPVQLIAAIEGQLGQGQLA